VHVLYLIDSLAQGGAERSLASLAPHFLSAGLRLDVAYLSERPGIHDQLLAAGVELFPLGTHRDRTRTVREVRRLLRNRSPDLVHTTLFESDVAGRVAGLLSGIRVVSSLVNDSYGPEQLSDPHLVPWKIRSAQVLDLATARIVTRFHAISRHIADRMARRLLIPRSRIDVIPRGRDPTQLGPRTSARRTAARRALGISATDPLVLAAARHEYQKGLDVLVQAMPSVLSSIPDARLVVAGRDGNRTAQLLEQVRQLGLDDVVRFLGARQDVPDLLCATDVFVAPSRWEGLGGSVLEAMALEAPIVASDIPPIREAVGEGTAVLVRPGDSEALATGIVGTLLEDTEAVRRSRRGRKRFLANFTLEVVAGAMISFYERALGSRRSST
jgi:glycosyltransferase involved in cell wall biosynthesis